MAWSMYIYKLVSMERYTYRSLSCVQAALHTSKMDKSDGDVLTGCMVQKHQAGLYTAKGKPRQSPIQAAASLQKVGTALPTGCSAVTKKVFSVFVFFFALSTKTTKISLYKLFFPQNNHQKQNNPPKPKYCQVLIAIRTRPCDWEERAYLLSEHLAGRLKRSSVVREAWTERVNSCPGLPSSGLRGNISEGATRVLQTPSLSGLCISNPAYWISYGCAVSFQRTVQVKALLCKGI